MNTTTQRNLYVVHRDRQQIDWGYTQLSMEEMQRIVNERYGYGAAVWFAPEDPSVEERY